MKKIRTLLSALKSGQAFFLAPYIYYKILRRYQMDGSRRIGAAPFGKDKDDIEIHVLTSKSSIIDMLFSIKSFLIMFGHEASVVIHGDGSLSEEERTYVKKHVPNAKVTLKAERDEIVTGKLKSFGYEECIKFRSKSVYTYKLFDVYLTSHARNIVLLDTDCISLRPLECLQHRVSEDNTKIYYIKDPRKHPYSLSKKRSENIIEAPLTGNVNAGLLMFPKSLIDLSRIEGWLSHPLFPSLKNMKFPEQTIYGFIASINPSCALPSDKYSFNHAKIDEGAELIHYADHYLSEVRTAMRRDGQKRVLRQLESVH